MRKKLFSILALLCLTVTSAWADADVTWNSSNVSDIRFWGGAPDGWDSYTKEGITLRGNAEQCDAEWADFGNGPGIMFAMNAPGGYTFTAPDGKKFTKIEITATTNEGWYTYAYFSQLESGWPAGEAAANDFNSTLKFTWTGSAASVNLATTLNSFGPSLASSIDFYFEAPAEPVASWVGNSAINANGTWYYAGSNFGWCTGGAFNGADLGTITTLSLGGQSQAWAEGNANWNDGNLTMTMGYKIDGGADESLSLNWFEFADNNNKFQSGGSSWAAQDIDISGLTPGNHTIAVWFTRDDKWDSNNSANYVANFTIPTPAATTYNVTLSANGNTKVVENVTLPHTFSCYYNGSIGVGDGELDLIIQELYGFSGGWCDESSPWMDNAVSGVTVGISSDNQYFSISTPFEGTAQVKGWYYRGWEDDFEYTLDIAIAAVEPEPEPEPQPAGYAVSLKAETADEGNWTAKAGEGEYQSLPLEGVAEGAQVSLKYSGLKKVKSVKAVKKAASAAGPTAYTLAESTQGMIVGTNGKAYDVADKDNLPSGVTAAGVVVYKNGANGLAIALTDEASMMDWDTACGENGAAAHTPAVEGCSWKLPSQEEWTLVKDANSASSLNSAITSAGGTAIPTGQFDPETMTMTGQYWLSTENGSDLARIWAINGWDEIVVSNADQDLKTSNNLVRACLAW